MTDPRARARREFAAAVVPCVVGALVMLLAVGRAWYTVHGLVAKPYPGSRVAGAVKPLAFVALAGAAALLATRRTGKVLVGALIAVVGVGGIVAASVAGAPHTTAAYDQHPVWRFVAVVGAVLVLLAGLLAAGRGRSWAEMSGRYDAPGSRTRVQDPDVALWDALDRGDDPTG